jgi:hypothetical protein
VINNFDPVSRRRSDIFPKFPQALTGLGPLPILRLTLLQVFPARFIAGNETGSRCVRFIQGTIPALPPQR